MGRPCSPIHQLGSRHLQHRLSPLPLQLRPGVHQWPPLVPPPPTQGGLPRRREVPMRLPPLLPLPRWLTQRRRQAPPLPSPEVRSLLALGMPCRLTTLRPSHFPLPLPPAAAPSQGCPQGTAPVGAAAAAEAPHSVGLWQRVARAQPPQWWPLTCGLVPLSRRQLRVGRPGDQTPMGGTPSISPHASEP